MGIRDHLTNLASGAGRTTVPLDLVSGERELLRAYANARPGTLTSVGGQLVLTTERIAFLPWNTADIAGFLAWALPKAGLPAQVGDLVGKVQDAIGGAGFASSVSVVDTGTDGSLLRPPTIVVSASDGSRHEFGILASMGSLNLSPRNRTARDEFVAAVRAAAG